MLQDFKDFITRGNVLDLAVGVIIGGAFSKIVTALTKYLLNPFIGLFLGHIDLSSLRFGKFRIGDFLNAVIEFIIIAFVVFLIVKFFQHWQHKKVVTKKPSAEEKYLQEIRDLLKTQKQ
ncbi:large conductance mechanosensitive channel protein MscL [Lactobacillus sp. DCY120]|uniref:Large-conductance mechanosensitive channel n=1 Tax=Bombilactobacillus apium TaxID=2675299 RepID=A0A850R2V6_9LACO|nr:large conductance mechanosensitive channel protein MscL [Bombilactobacillus apium]NVY96341.1 large conductance mechanosensitive channel protein MscL [Bombilactobacillus apium]